MDAKQAIISNIDMAKMIATSYLSDLSDEELMHRPHPKCNHIKWQLGHLLSADNQMVNGCCPGSLPELPEGFTEKYTKETAASDDPDQFHSKSEMLELYEAQTEQIKAAIEKLDSAVLDGESPEHMRTYVPTIGSMFLMLGSHWTMHAGQWAVIRRQLGREPLF